MRAAGALLKQQWIDIRFSSVWKSKATEVSDQADFLNAVCRFGSDETPESIFEKLQSIEKTLKKDPPFRFGPRTIDLDLLLVDDQIRKEDPILPHPKLHERRFVLEPLLELGAGELMHPNFHRTLKSYLPEIQKQECRKVEIQLS